MRFKLIINPVAGGKRGRSLTEKILERLRTWGISFEYEFSRYIGHATEIARRSVKGVDAVVAVGGDGTVNEVLNGIFGYNIPLGILPVGRGNDFFRTISNSRILDVILKPFLDIPKFNMVDVGRMNDRYFINVAGVGFDAMVAGISEPVRFLGPVAYLGSALVGLLKNKGIRLKLNIDGNKIDMNALMIAIANGRYFGGKMLIAPEASPWDGKFDVCLIENASKLEVLKTLPKVYSGKHIYHPKVKTFKAEYLEITSTGNMPVEMDGEIFYTDRLKIEMIPRSVPLILS
ncbi:MAG TPA: diacylglycerol kinase family lipid kinase [bacterium]|jgi:YegS/Rv2252/BmrU family lipid kinase|nr:diacylglycerol kinase family lipid kinase [bacterium]HOL55359.1 diacylglycerol kinase family lipid kinase [bacterium]HPC77192.1 diacylglycerol kinase family lipid kinase [bacterium]HPO82465.1 diacylglycerol kinase family lipid kinase [bacterium]HRR92030.1 diacylglycerol kinase family lipid kinase [bacterium]